MNEMRNQEPTPDYSLMLDIDNVGSSKALGYLPLITLRRLGEDIESLQRKYDKQGLGTFVAEKNVQGGALYVYDSTLLGQLLQRYEAVLKRENWPTDPAMFAKEVANRDGKGEVLKNKVV